MAPILLFLDTIIITVENRAFNLNPVQNGSSLKYLDPGSMNMYMDVYVLPQ